MLLVQHKLLLTNGQKIEKTTSKKDL